MAAPKVLKEKCPRPHCGGNLERTGEVWKNKQGATQVEYRCLLCNRTQVKEGTLDRGDFRSYG